MNKLEYMVCLLGHDWETVSGKISRFDPVIASIKECADCGKVKASLNKNEIPEELEFDLLTDARVAIYMDMFASEEAEGYPNKYDLELSWELVEYLNN